MSFRLKPGDKHLKDTICKLMSWDKQGAKENTKVFLECPNLTKEESKCSKTCFKLPVARTVQIWQTGDKWLLTTGQYTIKINMWDHLTLTFKWRWLINRGDHQYRFDCSLMAHVKEICNSVETKQNTCNKYQHQNAAFYKTYGSQQQKWSKYSWHKIMYKMYRRK